MVCSISPSSLKPILLKYSLSSFNWLTPFEIKIPSPIAVAPAGKILKLEAKEAASSLNFSSSTEDKENNNTKKQSSKFIKSLNVLIHAAGGGGPAISFFSLAIFIHLLHLAVQKLLHAVLVIRRISIFLLLHEGSHLPVSIGYPLS